MARLFIVGNGFDLSHNLKTAYKNFKEYLYQKSSQMDKFYRFRTKLDQLVNLIGELEEEEVGSDFDLEIEEIGNQIKEIEDSLVGKEKIELDIIGSQLSENLNFILDGHGNRKYNNTVLEDAVLLLLTKASGYHWSNLENDLKDIYFEECFEGTDYPLDEDGDEDFTKKIIINGDKSDCYKDIVKCCLDNLKEWIAEIDVLQAQRKEKIQKLIEEKESFFLSFNYTETLEKVYGVKNVKHIHGKNGDSKLYFGHGNNRTEKEENEVYYEMYNKYLGSEDDILGAQEKWRKKTEDIMEKNKTYFEELKSKQIDEIYFYGFSFGDVDMKYIAKIIAELKNEKVRYYLNDFDEQETVKQEEKLMKNGVRKEDIFRYTIE